MSKKKLFIYFFLPAVIFSFYRFVPHHIIYSINKATSLNCNLIFWLFIPLFIYPCYLSVIGSKYIKKNNLSTFKEDFFVYIWAFCANFICVNFTNPLITLDLTSILNGKFSIYLHWPYLFFCGISFGILSFMTFFMFHISEVSSDFVDKNK